MFQKIAKNTIFLSASQLIARIIGFFYFVFLARVLGVEKFGTYAFTIAFIYNFFPVADFGLEKLVLRDISREPERAQFYFSRLFPLRLFFAVGAYFAAIILGLVLRQPLQQLVYLAIYGLGIIPYSLVYLLASFQNAKEKMGYMAIANLSLISLTALLGIVFVLAKFSLIWIFIAYILGNLIVALVFFSMISKQFSFNWVIDKGFMKKSLGQCWVFAFMTILAVFYLRISVILLGLIKGAYFTGLYGSVFKFVDAIILIPQSLALALFPLSSKLFLENKNNLRRVYLKGLGWLAMFSIPLSLAMIAFPKFIIRFAYGDSYLLAAPSLSVLGIALALFFLNVLPGNVILNSPRVKSFLPLMILNFLVAVGLCLLLIPRYSILGAAYAVLGAEAFGFLLNNYFVWKELRA